MQATTGNQTTSVGILTRLQSIQVGGSSSARIKRKDLVGICRNLTTLVSNGVSLAQGLEVLATDRTLKRYQTILRSLADQLKTGISLSVAMKRYPDSFPATIIHQVHVGEQGGTLQATLQRITTQLEESSNLQSFLIKKLTYPTLLVAAGVGSVSFMMAFVIPTFQKMYEDSGATLPLVTEFMIEVAKFLSQNFWIVGAIAAAMVALTIYAFQHPPSRMWMDERILKIPVLGEWFRNMAMLQFMEILGNLMDSGFTLADALMPASQGVTNQYVQSRLLGLHGAIRRGERFSLAMEKEADLFPAVVKQLVVVGERAGRLGPITSEIRIHLRRDVEKHTVAMLGAIEPLLTAGLAIMVGGILMAIYLPMFDMIGQVKK